MPSSERGFLLLAPLGAISNPGLSFKQNIHWSPSWLEAERLLLALNSSWPPGDLRKKTTRSVKSSHQSQISPGL